MAASIVNVLFEKDTSSTSFTYFDFPRTLNSKLGLAGTALTAEFLLTATGPAHSSLVAGAKYIATWYFSSNGTLHTSNRWTSVLGTMGSWSSYLISFNASIVSNNPRWNFQPTSSAATKWVLKGSVWMTTTTDIS